jgi:hypothetical protein
MINARTMRSSATAVCLLAFMVGGSGVSWAKGGDHIRSGNAEIIPSIELKTVHRSNVYLSEGEGTSVDGDTTGVAEQSGTSLRLHPGLVIGIKGADSALNFNVDYNAIKYIEEEHKNLDRYKDVELGLGIHALDSAPVGFKLQERFHITGRETEATYATSAYINHIMNSSSARISIHPGSSLQVDVGGNVTYDKYDVSPNTSAEGSPALNSRLGYGPAVDLKWKFFPKTAIIATYKMTWFDWENNLLDARGDGISPEDVGTELGVPDGTEWRTTLGIRGRFTEKLVLGLVAGYGQMDYDSSSVSGAGSDESETNASVQGYDQDLKGFPEGFMAIVELGYHPVDSQAFSIGYRKSFQDVYFSNFVDFHNAFARYEGMFADKFGVKGRFGYRYEQYRGEVSRDDHSLGAGLNLSYRATPWMDIGSGVGWRQRGSADGNHSEIEYDDISINAGLTLTY